MAHNSNKYMSCLMSRNWTCKVEYHIACFLSFWQTCRHYFVECSRQCYTWVCFAEYIQSL